MLSNKSETYEIDPIKHSQNDNFSDRSTKQKLKPIRALLSLDCLETQNALINMMSEDEYFSFELFDSILDSLSTINNNYYDVVITDFCDHETYAGELIAKAKQASNNTALILLTN